MGKVLKKPFVETTEEEYDSMAAINSKAAYFFIQEAGRQLNDGGKICTVVTSLLAAYTGYYSTYGGMKAPVEHFTRAASKEFGGRGISVTAVGPGPMDTPFFYGQETPEAVAYHQTASALGGLTKIEDIVPLIRFLVSRRLVDHRPDDLRERRLHHPVITNHWNSDNALSASLRAPGCLNFGSAAVVKSALASSDFAEGEVGAAAVVDRVGVGGREFDGDVVGLDGGVGLA